MCTALYRKDKNIYFGRNLDLDVNINENVVIVPRNYPIHFKHHKTIHHHNAIIGVGQVINDYPLYYDAMNEYGVAIAGLNFPYNCKYFNPHKLKTNIASFELILYLLMKYRNVNQIKKVLHKINITNDDFLENLSNSPLHFMVSDLNECIVIEQTKEGLKLYENTYNVLTNNPPFELQTKNLSKYKDLTNEFKNISSEIYFSNGLSLVGLPGDYSSMSRFVKAYYINLFTPISKTNKESLINYFNVLNSVSMPLGAVKTPNGYEITRYSDCYNLNEIKLYYKTNKSPLIHYVDIYEHDVNIKELIKIPFNYDFNDHLKRP